MNDAWIRRAIQAVLIISALIVTTVLAFGIYDGTLAPGGAERDVAGSSRAGDGDSEGAAFGPSENYGLLMTADEGRVLRSIDPESGDISAEVELDGTPISIVPTPGGVSVWITFEDRSEIEVYSTDSLEHEATVTPEGADGRNPEHLTFSETGETLFVTWSGTGSISAYGHEMRELSLRDEFEADGTEGAVYRNRRATRVFRATEDGALGVFFAQTGQRMGTVDAPLSPDAPMRFNENRTVLWGVGRDGVVHAVDEAESDATRWDIRVSEGHAPVVLRGSNAPVFIDEERTGLVRMPSWSPDDDTEPDSSRSDPERLQIAGSGGVAGTEIVGMEPGPGGGVVLLTDAGELVRIDGERLEILDVQSVADTGAAGQGSSDEEDAGQRASLGDSARLVSYVIQSGGNFACF